MKTFLLSTALFVAPAVAFAGGGATAPADGMRDSILQGIHMIAHALGLM